jgi:ketosteroid isomerase-like protein
MKLLCRLSSLLLAVGLLVLPVACTRAPEMAQEQKNVRQVLDTYLQSVDKADVTLAGAVWLQRPDIVVVTPLGRSQGWENVRDKLYVDFLQKTFSERHLEPSNVVIEVAGEAAWAVFNWTFTAKLANGQPFSSKGWESHVYRKTDQGWRIAHLHYSGQPPAQ